MAQFKHSIGGLFTSVSCASLMLAQFAVPKANAQEQDGFAGLEEILVTAQRRTENLQQTPISISTVTGLQIQDQGLSTVTEFANAIPSVTIKSDFGTVNPNIYIRGVGSTDFNANVTGAVGVYIDEVVQASPAGQLLQFFDTEQIEVLRGPQGTLFGRNTTAGALNIVSRKPTDELSANAFVSFGRFNELKAEGGVGGPIIEDKLQGRIAAISHTRNGTIENDNTINGVRNLESQAPGRLNGIDTQAVRGQLRFLPTDSVDLLLNAHFARSDTSSYVFQHRGLLDPDEPVLPDGSDNFCPDSLLDQGTCVDYNLYADTDGDPFRGSYNGPSFEGVRTWGTNLKAIIDIGDLEFTSITGYESVERVTVLEVDESPFSAAIPYHNAEYDQYSQEIRLAGTNPGRLRWLVGAFYFKEDLDFDGEFEFVVPRKFGTGLAISPRYGYEQEVESWALFGQADYDITDQFTLTVGLRYSEETRNIDYRSGLSTIAPGATAAAIGYNAQPGYTLADPFDYELVGSFEDGTIIPLITLNDETNDGLRTNSLSLNDLSWRIALDYQVNEDVLIYVANSRGAKAGGFNGAFQTSISQNVALADEQLTAYEIGVKSEWLDNRLRLNASLFYYDYEDLQTYILGSVEGVSTPEQSPVNVNARNYGAEFEILAQPIEALTVSLNVAYLNTKVKSLGSGGVIPAVDVVGNELPIAPEFAVSGSATYKVPTKAGLFIFGTDFSYQDASTSDITNTPRLATDSFFLLGARAAFRTNNDLWEFALYGRNILNDKYRTFVANIDFLGYDRVRFGDQATYGASVSYRF